MINEIEKIKEMYLVKKMTGKEIAKELGYKSPQTIFNKMDKYKIKRRNTQDCQKPIKIFKTILNELYYKKELSLKEIGNKCNCSEETIRRLMEKNNLERRDNIYNFGGWNKGILMPNQQKEKISKTRKELYKNGKIKHWNKGNKWSLKIRRKISNSLIGRFREQENPNWKGGLNTPNQRLRRRIMGNLRYNQWRLEIYKRDDFKCQLCNKKSKGDLQAHHIIKIIEKPLSIFNINNGITLCKDCHIHKVNQHEKEFESLFIDLINKKRK